MPGDLTFTPGSDGTAADPGRVGMYTGSGLVIQAPETGEDIEITPFCGYFQENTDAGGSGLSGHRHRDRRIARH
jgi:hypothetical protein